VFHLHEVTDLRPDAVDAYAAAFDATYHPLMEDLGARLVALWEAVPFSHRWPRTVTLWEIDDFRTLAGIGRARRQHERSADRFAGWRAAVADLVTGGEGRVLTPSPLTPTIAELRERGVAPTVVVQERIHTVPGQQFAYVRALEERYVPWAERNGRRFLGAYTTNWRNSEAILVWAWDRGWDTLAEHYGRQQQIITHDPDLSRWMVDAVALRDDWDDAILEALRSY
jgi:hypothetical protein